MTTETAEPETPGRAEQRARPRIRARLTQRGAARREPRAIDRLVRRTDQRNTEIGRPTAATLTRQQPSRQRRSWSKNHSNLIRTRFTPYATWTEIGPGLCRTTSQRNGSSICGSFLAYYWSFYYSFYLSGHVKTTPSDARHHVAVGAQEGEGVVVAEGMTQNVGTKCVRSCIKTRAATRE